MWSFYGSKSKLVNYYPPPRYDTIIEPFAGSARYSLKYFDRNIILIEKDKKIVGIWKWLQSCSPKDILSLPEMKKGENIDNFNFDCQEAKWFMGFIIGAGFGYPRKTVSLVGNFGTSIEREKKRVSENLYKIKNWDIRLDDYRNIDNREYTWFIDPPYQFGGKGYRIGSKTINYPELAEWCKERNGQVIVCENMKATWLDFKPLKEIHGSNHTTMEMVWIK
jgi:site-specific DNA-adenine methylase